MDELIRQNDIHNVIFSVFLHTEYSNDFYHVYAFIIIIFHRIREYSIQFSVPFCM